MATLIWDEVGKRYYHTGVDHGVLYLHDGTVVAWNGITSVEESSNSDLKSFYLEGVKFLETLTPRDYVGKLKAVTYPEEFEHVSGLSVIDPGFSFHEQQAKSFNLSYRTRVGNDLEGTEFGYRIHILYNVIANPEDYSVNSLADAGQLTEFSWSLTGTPPTKIVGYRSTVHVSIDSTKTPPELMDVLEKMLYGSETSAPSLPSIVEIAEFFGYHGALIVVDHGDGTWTALDYSDTFITMTDPTTFEIIGADATYLDSDTYTLSSTNVAES